MRIFRHQQILLAVLAALLLLFGQPQHDDHSKLGVWRPQAEAAFLAPLRLVDLPHGTVLPKFRQPPLRWNDGTSFIPVTSSMEVAFSNTSFMAGHHCVCIPLRL